jgi:DNA-binding XRE family transcriptional regulator
MAQTRLKQLREEAVLTVHELGEASGVSDDTISKIENGQRVARPSTLRKLARALNVSPQELRRPAKTEELAGAGKAEAPSSGRLPEWATTSDLSVLNQNVTEVSSEELRDAARRLATGLKWNKTLEDLRNEPRSESVARVLNLARTNILWDEFLRRGEEPPKVFVVAFRQWLKAVTPSPDSEPQSETSHRASEAG